MNNSVLFDRLAKSAGFLKALNNVLLWSRDHDGSPSGRRIHCKHTGRRPVKKKEKKTALISTYCSHRWRLCHAASTSEPGDCCLQSACCSWYWCCHGDGPVLAFWPQCLHRKRLVLLKQENIKFWSWISPKGIALKQVCIHSVAWRNLRSMLCDHSRQLSVWIWQHLQSCLFFNMKLVLLQEKPKELTALWPCCSDCFLWTNFTLDTPGEAPNGHQQWNPAYTAIVSTCVFTRVWREEVLQNAFCELQNRLGTHLLCLCISMS